MDLVFRDGIGTGTAKLCGYPFEGSFIESEHESHLPHGHSIWKLLDGIVFEDEFINGRLLKRIIYNKKEKWRYLIEGEFDFDLNLINGIIEGTN